MQSEYQELIGTRLEPCPGAGVGKDRGEQGKFLLLIFTYLWASPSLFSLVADHVFLLHRTGLPSYQFIGSQFQNETSLSFWVVSVPKLQLGSCLSRASQPWSWGKGPGTIR